MFVQHVALKSWVQKQLCHLQFAIDFAKTHPTREMQMIAFRETMEYVSEHMRGAAAVCSSKEILDLALAAATIDGEFLEFGVFSGGTLNYMAKRRPDLVFHGFDSFEGLPEGWIGGGTTWRKGAFDRKGRPPRVRRNVRIHKGIFADTLPRWKEDHSGRVAFLHIDSDLYSSAKCVFDHLADRIAPGTVILFDEYFNYPNWQQHEFRAFQEFVSSRAVQYEYIGFARIQAAVEISAIG